MLPQFVSFDIYITDEAISSFNRAFLGTGWQKIFTKLGSVHNIYLKQWNKYIAHIFSENTDDWLDDVVINGFYSLTSILIFALRLIIRGNDLIRYHMIYILGIYDKIPHDKFPRDKSPHGKIPQGKIYLWQNPPRQNPPRRNPPNFMSPKNWEWQIPPWQNLPRQLGPRPQYQAEA